MLAHLLKEVDRSFRAQRILHRQAMDLGFGKGCRITASQANLAEADDHQEGPLKGRRSRCR
jgi:hypothetical protein